MGKIRLDKHSSGSDRKKDHFERTASGTARAASFAAGDFAATAAVKRAATAFVGAPEDSNNVETAIVARFEFWFSKTVKKYAALSGTKASAFAL